MNISDMNRQFVNHKVTHDFDHGKWAQCRVCCALAENVRRRIVSRRCTVRFYHFYPGPNHSMNSHRYSLDMNLKASAQGSAVHYDPFLDISCDEWAKYGINDLGKLENIDLDEEWPVEETRIGLVKEEIDWSAHRDFMKGL